jgi:DNA topoisomerase I
MTPTARPRRTRTPRRTTPVGRAARARGRRRPEAQEAPPRAALHPAPAAVHEASLVKELEEQGIGRPSTYAAILSVIVFKEYVEKRENRFYPTELGTLVNELLVKAFPAVLDVGFTAEMEEQLDEIADGNLDWVKVLSEFYGPFKKELAEAEDQHARREARGDPHRSQVREVRPPWSSSGASWAASSPAPATPSARTPSDFKTEADGTITPIAEQVTDKICEKCGRPMAVKRGRFGRFLACTGYPECKNSLPIGMGVMCPSPTCKGGELTERRSRRGKTFFGCNKYPECTFAAWDRPVPEKCPECGSPYLLQKFSKRDGAQLVCPNSLKGGSCTFRKPMPETGPVPPPLVPAVVGASV